MLATLLLQQCNDKRAYHQRKDRQIHCAAKHYTTSVWFYLTMPCKMLRWMHAAAATMHAMVAAVCCRRLTAHQVLHAMQKDLACLCTSLLAALLCCSPQQQGTS